MSDWQSRKLRELFISHSPGEWGANPQGNEGDFYVLRSTNFTNDGHLDYSNVVVRQIPETKRSRCRLEVGDILLEKSGGGPDQAVGRIAIFEKDRGQRFGYANFIERLCVAEGFEPKFVLFRLLQSYRDGITLRYEQQTTGIRNLKLCDFLDEPVLAPPLPEQRKIARILTTLDNLIERTEALISKYQAIKQGMMYDLFTRGVDEHGHLRPLYEEAPELYKQSELGWIPNEWEVRRLDELYASPIRDFGSFSSTNLITFLESGIPFIKSEMIEAEHINWNSVTYISDHVHRLLNKSHVRAGDILFSKIGSALGKGVVYDGSRGVCNSNAAVAKIDIDHRVAGRQFVTHFLNHDIAKVQLRNMIVSLLPRINLGDLNRLLVPCPTTDEQQQIEERLLSSGTSIKTETASLRHLFSIKSGLMQDLLTGKVRVKVDEASEVVHV